MTLEKQREADAKQQGEDGIELPIDQHILEEPYHLVDATRPHGGLILRTQESPQGKLREIGEGDAHQGKAPQGIKNEITLFLCNGSF